MEDPKLRLVVVPSDPIATYEKKGIGSWLEAYYNPQKLFQEVFALSPLEEGERTAYGMNIRGVHKKDFLNALKEIRPNVIRAYGGFWPADLVCCHRLPNVPVVVSVHDTNPSLLHKSVRYADLVICMSKAVEKRVKASGIDVDRIRILPNRVDTDIFHPIKEQESLGFLESRFPKGKHILHVGRKAHEKNIDTLVRSLQFLPPQYSCIFVGLGDPAPYKELAKQMGVSDRCFWVKSVENSELPYWYSWCDCMCTPSRWEGFGLVFIEAAACGAAIVTSDIEPMNEYLTHNISALLVKEYEKPKSLSDAIRKVCEQAEYRRMISDGAAKAVRPFERSIIDAAEASIYKEALSLKPLSLSLLDKTNLSLWRVTHRISTMSRRVLGPVLPQFGWTRR
ncbi:MAG: glycosyltransferase family 4 protein [Desulfobacteraceae bacterium]|nr:glycosyltransferase family 4 protein [Desulfobacteraceae bacterium]